MREVGGLVLDSKHGEDGASQRLDGRTRELEAVDGEARTLAQALEDLTTLDELLASGVSARCPNCGELVARRERHCLSCGAELPQRRESSRPAAGTGQRQPARAPQPTATTAAATGANSGRSPTPPAR